MIVQIDIGKLATPTVVFPHKKSCRCHFLIRSRGMRPMGKLPQVWHSLLSSLQWYFGTFYIAMVLCSLLHCNGTLVLSSLRWYFVTFYMASLAPLPNVRCLTELPIERDSAFSTFPHIISVSEWQKFMEEIVVFCVSLRELNLAISCPKLHDVLHWIVLVI